jgi:hypothetical protein
MFEEKNADDSSSLLKKLRESVSFVEEAGKAYLSNFDAGRIASAVEQVDNAAVNIAKSFGQGRENVLGLSQAMAGAVREVTLLGGNFESIAKIQKEVGEGLGRNLILTTDSYEKLFAASEVTGQSAKDIVTFFKDAGFSAYQATGQMQKVVDVTRQMGVNTQVVSGVVLQNMDALNKYNFAGGVEGLAKMAGQASLLRINMKETLNFAEKVFDPEGAIEVAAAMQRLGVANSELLDPLRLMDMAQNDPAELQNQLAKMTEQFVQLNKDGQFEIMPGAKRQLREISSALNIPYETLTKMAIGTKELDEKLKQINFAGFDFDEATKNAIAQMAEMGEDKKFKIQVGTEKLDLDEAMVKFRDDPKLLEALKESAQPKSMEKLAEEQLKMSEQMAKYLESMSNQLPMAIAGTRAAKGALAAPARIVREASNVLTGPESFSITKLTKGIDEGANKILTDINKLVSGEGSMTQLLTTMSDVGKQFENFTFKYADEMTVKYTESIKNLEGANNQFIDILLNSANKVKTMFMTDQNLNTPQTPTPLPPQTTNPQMGNVNNPTNTPMGNQPNQTNTQTNNSPVDINLNITAPPNIDTNQLVIALNDTGVREAMVTALNKARMNDNLSATNPNPQRQMVVTNNSTGLTGIPVA